MQINMDCSEMQDNDIIKILSECVDIFKSGEQEQPNIDALCQRLRILRNLCQLGKYYQEFLIDQSQFWDIVNKCTEINDSDSSKIILMNKIKWQILANACVTNPVTSNNILHQIGNQLFAELRSISPYTNIQLMLLYNCTINNSTWNDFPTFERVICIAKKCFKLGSFEGMHALILFLEFYITKHSNVYDIYTKLSKDDACIFLHCIVDLIEQENAKIIANRNLLENISASFCSTSQTIINDNKDSSIDVKYLYAMLEVIAKTSGSDVYRHLYVHNNSLFINIGCLLSLMSSIESKLKGFADPMNKLDEVAPASNIDNSYEKDISFEFKTLLVRCIANLAYKNSKNQLYAVDMKFHIPILNCTRMDARNPMIKEWSILAIRNLCENCPQMQTLISQFVKIGDVKNEIVKELNLDMNLLRIKE